ncbi:hypothetical protein BU251_07420 [Candidatus Velamenicoccus archaeovorus]|uniref:DUF2889 domain-containing protein n=1 Tax=Velamenicoccus archaeovorus TaxID=1930593 RepID=A0A410P5U1_VELA1|nr:DUF2889 domain-containing protein [Candidatus Velamenicoccus archaeovorus]QAT17557.1 hypothetical protein BU251_07420 [Candidatus Velamenicoccus archaeovorus]
MKFARNIQIDLEIEKERGRILSSGSFSDDYHDFKCRMIFKLPNLEVVDVKVEINKLPKEVCRVPFDRLVGLRGVAVGRGFRQKVKKAIGGDQGCIHLVDLIHEIAQGIVALLRKAQMTPDGKEMKDFPDGTFYGVCMGLNKGKLKVDNNED